MYFKKKLLKIFMIILILNININVYATTQKGDADNDGQITAYDAYLVLKYSLNDSVEDSIVEILDMDGDNKITSYDAYSILKKSIEENVDDYITPEMYGAKGDGVTDDTDAFEECMKSDKENVLLSGNYLITRNLTATNKKSFYNGKILCEVETNKVFTFVGNVTFKGTEFSSNVDVTGTSPHGETYEHTSNMYFVEVWGQSGTFIGCTFQNALIAIRGRISEGETIVPENLYVVDCDFIECKIPIQGYFANAEIENTNFKNEGDLYSGDHCVYLETYGGKKLSIKECKVETLNTESGAAFQIYGKEKSQTDTVPIINIDSCNITANGIVSTDVAEVTVSNTDFDAQHSQRFVFTVEEGSLLIDGCTINHSSFISYGASSAITPVAKDSEFRINKELTNDRGVFPAECYNCKFVNWGGVVKYENTKILNCIFTRDTSNVVGKYYIGIAEGLSVFVEDSAFKAGDDISYNSLGTIHLTNCFYTNNIGNNVPNVEEIGTIAEDITD